MISYRKKIFAIFSTILFAILLMGGSVSADQYWPDEFGTAVKIDDLFYGMIIPHKASQAWLISDSIRGLEPEPLVIPFMPSKGIFLERDIDTLFIHFNKMGKDGDPHLFATLGHIPSSIKIDAVGHTRGQGNAYGISTSKGWSKNFAVLPVLEHPDYPSVLLYPLVFTEDGWTIPLFDINDFSMEQPYDYNGYLILRMRR